MKAAGGLQTCRHLGQEFGWNYMTYSLSLQREAEVKIFRKLRYSTAAMYTENLKLHIQAQERHMFRKHKKDHNLSPWVDTKAQRMSSLLVMFLLASPQRLGFSNAQFSSKN